MLYSHLTTSIHQPSPATNQHDIQDCQIFQIEGAILRAVCNTGPPHVLSSSRRRMTTFVINFHSKWLLSTNLCEDHGNINCTDTIFQFLPYHKQSHFSFGTQSPGVSKVKKARAPGIFACSCDAFHHPDAEFLSPDQIHLPASARPSSKAA